MGTSAISAAGLILQAGGAINSAVGSYQSGNTARANYALQAQSARLNQSLSDLNAGRARQNAKALELNAKAAELAAWVSGQNVKLAERGAEQELIKGNAAVGKLTQEAGALKSAQRASLAANGVDLGVGSAAEVQASTDLMKEADKATLISNALRSAFGYKQAGINAGIQGMNAKMTAANYRTEAGNQRLNAIEAEMRGAGYGSEADMMSGMGDSISPGLMASSSLLGGATGVLDSWYRYRRTQER